MGPRRAVWLTVALATLVALVSMATGTYYLWPDFVHTDYGFPLVWGTHVEDTLIGPVDKWQVNFANLGIDILFWAMVVLVAATLTGWAARQWRSKPGQGLGGPLAGTRALVTISATEDVKGNRPNTADNP